MYCLTACFCHFQLTERCCAGLGEYQENRDVCIEQVWLHCGSGLLYICFDHYPGIQPLEPFSFSAETLVLIRRLQCDAAHAHVCVPRCVAAFRLSRLINRQISHRSSSSLSFLSWYLCVFPLALYSLFLFSVF